MNITVSQRAMANRFTIQLHDRPLLYIAVVINMPKNFLHDFSLCRGGRPPKDIKCDVKPLVDLFVKLVVLVTDLTWGKSLLLSLCFRGCAVLIGATDVHDVNFALPEISTIDICTEDCSDNISKMGIVVNVRKGACNEDVAP